MEWWGTLVGALQSLMATVGDGLGGGLAVGIFVVTLAIRLALVPVMLPLGVRTRDRNAVVRRMRPELQALKQQYRKDPDALHREIAALHERRGIKLVDGPGLLAALIQLPVLIALFQAVYHASENTALAAPGFLTGTLASALAVLGLWLGGQADSRPLLALSLFLPLGIAAWLGQGIGLYLVAFYAGSALQALLMRRRAAPPIDVPAATLPPA